MLPKLNRYFFTIIYIHPIQAFFQLWYRIKRLIININYYSGLANQALGFMNLPISSTLIMADGKYIGHNKFKFIGILHEFSSQINWNYDEFGKLWNYNLQYLDFLLDNSISVEERLRLLSDFNLSLLAEKVKPEPYPISLRIVNTLLFISQYKIKDLKIEEGLQKQLDYLDKNLEYHLLANHLLENCISAYILYSAFSKNSKKSKYKLKIIKQLEIQILNDGGHYECSPMYHGIILSKILLLLEVAINNKDYNFVNFLKQKVEVMSGWLIQYCFPDGSLALMNDAAEGVAPTMNLIKEAINKFGLEPKFLPLKDSGFKKLVGRNWECIIKVGNIKPTYQPGHTHADMLTFCLWEKNLGQFVVDPGISTYNNNKQRYIERSTASHNTVSINGNNQSDVWGSFRIGKRAYIKLISERNNELLYEVKNHSSNIVHLRTFSYEHDYLFIKDEIKCYIPTNFNSSILFNNSFNFTNDSKILNNSNVEIYTNPNHVISRATFATHFNELKGTYKLTISSSDKQTTKFTFK
jgi:hypothetical protein